MQPLENLFQQVDQLDPQELDLFLQNLAQRIPSAAVSKGYYPAIVATPGVCGGAARLVRTRIPVWTLEQMRRSGFAESDILHSFPTLCAADLVQAWQYVAEHAAEIQQAIRENEEA